MRGTEKKEIRNDNREMCVESNVAKKKRRDYGIKLLEQIVSQIDEWN